MRKMFNGIIVAIPANCVGLRMSEPLYNCTTYHCVFAKVFKCFYLNNGMATSNQGTAPSDASSFSPQVPSKQNPPKNSKIDKLAIEGLKSIRGYFLYTFVGLLLGFIIIALVISIIFSAGSGSSISGYAYGIGSYASTILFLTVLLLVIIVAIAVFEVFAALSLMFAIRDLRRSGLKSASVYSSVSKWLKYLTIIFVIISAVYMLFTFFLLFSLFSASALYGGASSGTGSLISFAIVIVFTIIFAVIELLFIWKLYCLYKSLSEDLSSPRLGTSAKLLVVGVAIAVIAGIAESIASIASAGLLSGGSSLLIVLLLVFVAEIIAVIILAIAQWLGYKSVSDALVKV